MSNQKNNQKPKPPGRRGQGRARRGGRQQQSRRGDQKKQMAPVASTNINRTRKPKVETLSNGDCRITHREYVEDIVAGVSGPPTTLSVQGLPINPGQNTTFQWLSKIAANYESYVFEALAFCYETEAPTSLGGTLMLAIDYDAADPAPTSKQQAMAYRSSTRTAPWAGCRHSSLREDLKKSKTNFIRVGAQPPNTDIKTYDIGNLWILSQGIGTSGATLGELYVEYTVKLMTPVYETPADSIVVGGSGSAGGSMSGVNPLGTTPLGNASNFGITVGTDSKVTFAYPGLYLVVTDATGTGLDMASPEFGPNEPIASVLDAKDTSGVFVFAVNVPTAPVTLQYSLTGATSVIGGAFYIGTAPLTSLA